MLNIIWFILITVLFVGFFFLEGFDYGVGILHPFVAKNDMERRVVMNSIGPFWDGNEVWMITAGGALFASFPEWYATLFSGFYLALVLILFALILRGISFEFRSKVENPSWRKLWDGTFFVGSLFAALLWGVAVGNLLRGVPIGPDKYYHGGLLPLLNPYALATGLAIFFLFVLHGANYLVLKTEGPVAERAGKYARTLWIIALVLTVIFVVWSFFATDIFVAPGAWLVYLSALIAAVALIMAGVFIYKNKFGAAFVSTSLTIVFAVVMTFAGLYPRVMISTIDPKYSLTIYNASASQYTLKAMLIVAVVLVPIVLAYQIWTYYIFREKISPDKELEY